MASTPTVPTSFFVPFPFSDNPPRLWPLSPGLRHDALGHRQDLLPGVRQDRRFNGSMRFRRVDRRGCRRNAKNHV